MVHKIGSSKELTYSKLDESGVGLDKKARVSPGIQNEVPDNKVVVPFVMTQN